MTLPLARRRQLLFALVTVALLALFIEGASYLAVRLAFSGDVSRSHLAEERSNLVDASPATVTRRAALPEEETEREVPYLMHPYYGYVAFPTPGRIRGCKETGIGCINELGFVSTAPAVLSRSSERFIVAIAGGSVAYFGSTWGREALLRELRLIPELAGREILVTTYAMGAFKEPQHLLAVSDALTRGGAIDLLILIDGFNEAVLGININRVFRVDPFFPHYWFRLAEDMPSLSDLRAIGEIEYLKEERKRNANRFSRLGARYSIFASLVWKSIDSRLSRQIASARRELAEGTGGASNRVARLHENDRVSFGTYPDYRSVRDFYMHAATSWATASIFLDRMIEAQGGRYFHFLQPNQYFPDSKPLTSAERKLMLPKSHPQYWNLATGYPYFRAAGEQVNAAGVSFVDFTYLFEDHAETLYHDSCCHVNQRGNDILMSRVGRIIRESFAARADDAASRTAEASFRRFANQDVYSLENLRRFGPRNSSFDDGSDRPW